MKLRCLFFKHRWEYVNQDAKKPRRCCTRCHKRQVLDTYLLWQPGVEPKKWYVWENEK